ncbi:adenylyl-sulfate kinase [Microlunatus capsulatus]|uniref:Chloramphenicol 3-O-phosphotransferase n=1 Tax=Microlunatus capsulatus TaxID=99117 RepID=A0ABS4ZA81_9ACTN|nr:adenylyl-sulfate kinase [Microlunatus capsulatus]MBP2417889.1 chloramphenicol 3-O-phosphotransferase [Microlunatus capsulatus]
MTADPRPYGQLVLVTGPVAAGKSTVAARLTERLVAAGLTVACTDHDDVARLGHAPGGLTEEHWDRAHETHGVLVGALLRQPFDVVIAHGPVYTPVETAAVLAHVPAGTPVRRVLLTCPLGSAHDRVTGDPERGLSRDPVFLQRTHARFWALRPEIEADLVVDTSTTGVDAVCARVEALLRPVGTPAPGAPGGSVP